MYQRNLLTTVDSAIRMWGFHRKTSGQFRRWLKLGKIVFSPHDNDIQVFPAMLLKEGIASGVDEMAFVGRHLRGLREIESHPDFWKIDSKRALDEGLKAARNSAVDNWEARLEHHARFSGFSRIDRYDSVDGTVRLAGGYEVPFFEDTLQVLRENLGEPRTLAVVNEYPEHAVKGHRCTVSVTRRACGVELGHEGLGLKFVYTG